MLMETLFVEFCCSLELALKLRHVEMDATCPVKSSNGVCACLSTIPCEQALFHIISVAGRTSSIVGVNKLFTVFTGSANSDNGESCASPQTTGVLAKAIRANSEN